MVDMAKIVGLAVAVIIASALVPSAVVSITNTTLWEGAPAAVTTLVPVIGIVAVVALLLAFLKGGVGDRVGV